MKLNVLALSALLALAAAADTTTSEAAKTTVSAEVECAKKCDLKDTCCIAACHKVPCPSDSQANDTNSCVAACPQGTGSPADTQKYADCEQKCFSSHFFPATGAAATQASSKTSTASDSSATETGSEASGSKSSASGSSDASGTASGSSSTPTNTNAANNVKLGASGAGLFGLVLAAFAL